MGIYSYYSKIGQIFRTGSRKKMQPVETAAPETASHCGMEMENGKNLNIRQLLSAIEGNPCSIMITDKNGIIEYVNPAFSRITGYSPAEVIGKSPAILSSGKHPPELYRAMWEAISEGKRWDGELLDKNSVDELRWHSVSITPVLDDMGNIVNYIGTHEDINQKKQYELQVRILRQAVDKSPVSIMTTDKSDNITYVNPFFSKLTGYSYDEVVGRKCSIMKGNHHTPEYYESIRRTIDRGEVWQGELCNVKKNGEEFWEQAIITPVSSTGDNSIDHFVTVKSDITYSRKAEEALRDSEYRFKNILASMDQGFWRVDNSGYTLEVNSALCEMLGIREKDLIGRNIYDFLDKEYQEKIKNNIKNWNPRSRNSFEMVIMRQDHGVVHSLISTTPLFDQENNRVGAFAVITDFTKRKEMERQIIEARDRAENASKVKSEFLANMSHEIRTPMNSILGFLELALEDKDLTFDQRSRLSIARSSANALLTILNDILDLSKIEQKQLPTEIRPFDIRELVKSRLDQLEIKAGGKNLELDYQVAPDIAEKYLGDPVKIGQVLTNLIGNAIKFTNYGRITVKVERYDRSDTILFSITDTGIGIPYRHTETVFEPFSQADASITRRFSGAGVGATISKQLVELMGGKIWFSSREEEGTVFYFTVKLPPVYHIKNSKDLNIMTSEKTPSGFKILMADDLEENILLTRLFMKKSNHTVTGVHNGLDAVKRFQEEDFDVILMDVNMPEMDGIEATIRIRELEKGSEKKIPIIAVTASAMSEETKLYSKIGMSGCISKPINFKELNILIENLVDESRKSPDTSGSQIKIVENSIIQGTSIPLEKKADSEATDTGIESINSAEVQKKPLTEKNRLNLADLSGVDMGRALENWSTPAIFRDILIKFYRDHGDSSEKIEEMIQTEEKRVKNQAPPEAVEKNSAMGESNGLIKEVRGVTHALKGLSGNLSLSAIFTIFTAMDRAAMENRVDIVKSFLPALKVEIDRIPQYIEALGRLDSSGHAEKKAFSDTTVVRDGGSRLSGPSAPGQFNSGSEPPDRKTIEKLISDLIAACEQYNPDAIYPYIDELGNHIEKSELKPLVEKTDSFDFDGVKKEALSLSDRLLK